VTVRIRVCRDCCCGTPEKHPDVDHDALLAELVAGTRDHADVSVTTCLLACDRSNVVVVSPGPYWFGRVLTRHTAAEVAAWIRAGGPKAALPETLERHRIRPPLQASTAPGREAAQDGDGGA
jgi:(2Fe-2S) ferredoxin